jgi:mannose-6-phosphate isomerase
VSAPLYPLILAPKLVPLLWGGDALVRRYGKQGDPEIAIGESWECWDENRVVNGAFAGETLARLRAELGGDLLGSLDPGQVFPILTKFIDARQALSVQAHPDDAYARRVEKQPNGKTECWYILEAAPGASIVLGWSRDTSREEYLARVKDGTLGELLRHVPVKAGDVFYLPAGTLHSIGAGIVLFEVQQASDLTYRIFDWNRVGADGKPRPLHVEKAADVLDFRESHAVASETTTRTMNGLERTTLIADAHFTVERAVLDASERELCLYGMPMIVTALGDVEMCAKEGNVLLKSFQTALLPSALGSVRIKGVGGANAVLIVAPPWAPR